MLLANTLHHRSALLELAERSCMKPDVLFVLLYLLTQNPEGLPMAVYHQPYLLAEERGYAHANDIYVNYKTIHSFCLLQNLYCLSHSVKSLFFAKECRNIKHVRALALAHEC